MPDKRCIRIVCDGRDSRYYVDNVENPPDFEIDRRGWLYLTVEGAPYGAIIVMDDSQGNPGAERRGIVVDSNAQCPAGSGVPNQPNRLRVRNGDGEFEIALQCFGDDGGCVSVTAGKAEFVGPRMRVVAP